MTDLWGTLPDLLTRADAMEDDAADLAEDVVELFGDDSEEARAAGEIHASVSVLIGALREAAAVRGDQP